MNREVLKRFMRKQVKLVKEGYALYGMITEVSDDCLIFESKDAVSAISLDVVDAVILISDKG